MSRILIDCPRCSESTHVEMDHSLTGQRCEHCGSFLYSADTGVKVEKRGRKVRRKGWQSLTSTEAQRKMSETVDASDAHQRRGFQSWYLPTFLVALLGMIVVIGYLVKRQNSSGLAGKKTEPEHILQTSLQKAEQDKQTLVPATTKALASTPSPEWTQNARTVSEKFLRATTVEEMLPFVRNQALVKPSIEAYAAKEGNLPIAKAGIMDIVYAPEEESKTGSLAMLFFENNQQHIQGLVLAETPEGMLVDWHSFSGEGEMSIKEFLEKKPTEPTLLRVAARLDDYYNFEYQNRDLVSCLRLTDYPETLYFYGYVLRSSPLIDKLSSLPTQDHQLKDDLQVKPQPLTIKARFQEGSRSPNQVEITEILGNGWFVR